jgi:hypothetical protein
MKSLSDDGFITIMADNKLSWKEKLPLNMFMLTFDNSEDTDKIYKITHILACKVQIQPMRGSKLIPPMQEMPGVWAHSKVLLKGAKIC